MKPCLSEQSVPETLKKHKSVKEEDTFTFACHSGVACFGTCCKDISIFLTPLDVLTLARAAGLDTDTFLAQHTLLPVTRDLHLPVVLLKMNDEDEKRCPFVGPKGCTVYDARPWACRMYPLGTALPPARVGPRARPQYFLMQDSFCLGTTQNATQRVDTYRKEQGVVEREEIETGYQEIVSHPWFIGGRTLDTKRIEMFHLAAYNLDKFRRFVFESSFLDRFKIDEAESESWKTDDVALLKFAFSWLKFVLFGEPVLKLREDVSN